QSGAGQICGGCPRQGARHGIPHGRGRKRRFGRDDTFRQRRWNVVLHRNAALPRRAGPRHPRRLHDPGSGWQRRAGRGAPGYFRPGRQRQSELLLRKKPEPVGGSGKIRRSLGRNRNRGRDGPVLIEARETTLRVQATQRCVYPTCARWRSALSASTQAIIASPTGTARMPTQGSWRPLVTISVSTLFTSTVLRGERIDEVGLTAKRQTIGWPVEMPPTMPPAWLARKRGLPSFPARISSAFSSPVSAAAAKPSPISTPLTALMLIIAPARSPSSLA